jgi:hypothetical protein
MTDRPDTLVDRILTRAKNHRVLGVLIIVGIVIIGVGKFVGAVKPILELFPTKQSQPPMASTAPANDTKSGTRNGSDTRSLWESNSNTASNTSAATMNHVDNKDINGNRSPLPQVNRSLASSSTPSSDGPQITKDGSTAPSPTPTTSPGIGIAAEDILGSWNFEYLVQNQNWKRRITFRDKNLIAIDNPAYAGFDIGQPFSPQGRWDGPRNGFVTVYFRTLIDSETGTFKSGDVLYREISCRLRVESTGSLLEGRCTNGRSFSALRLTR